MLLSRLRRDRDAGVATTSNGWGVDADLRGLRIALRHGEVETSLLWIEEAGARPARGRDGRGGLVVVGVDLLDHADATFAAGDVDAVGGLVEPDVVGVAAGVRGCDDLSALRIKNEHLRRVAANDDQPMPGLIQRHREIGLSLLYRPLRDDALPIAVHNLDQPGRWDVDENAVALAFELE